MTLGLVTIEEFPKFEADSDGDIIVHSIANAILNGLGAGDLGAFIGMGIATTGQEIVAKLNKLLQDKGASIVNISVNFIGNKPNISKYRNEMEIELSEALGNAPVPSLRANGVATSGCVTISAATTDGLGFTGQGEGAYCTSTVLLSFQG
jgi:2-C-methyl-D-erythritol 2,4-cyclodiphosphate synthase